MKTKLIQIRRVSLKDPNFVLTLTRSKEEREDEPTAPAACGFYHANQEEPDELSVKKLKSAMINSIDKQIAGLRRDRRAILEISLKDLAKK